MISNGMSAMPIYFKGKNMKKEKPILFSGPMVRAILNDAKTQTRREIKIPDIVYEDNKGFVEGDGVFTAIQEIGENIDFKCRYYAEELWVKETFARFKNDGEFKGGKLIYRADEGWATAPNIRDYIEDGKWKPSIFMNRKASRIQLKVKDIWVERLDDISEEDAIAEGIVKVKESKRYISPHNTQEYHMSAKKAFKALWESINGKGSWDDNPFVWCVKFERLKP